MIISSSCRNVDLKSIVGFKKKDNIMAGDILLARIDSLGFYDSIEIINGKIRKLKVGENILVVQGNRYATQAHEIIVSDKNVILGSLGGIVGNSVDRNATEKHTKLNVVGYAIDRNNSFLNLKNFSVLSYESEKIKTKPKVIVVMGSDMDSGKTTCAAYLAKKFTSDGKIVNYGKITGTARLKDLLEVKKNRASIVLDFTDCGYATTYKTSVKELQQIINTLYLHLSKNNPDYIIFEIADGLLQNEVAMIIKKRLLSKFNPQVAFCCRDSLAVGEAMKIFRKYDLSISFVSGPVSNSGLGIKEVKNNFNISCIDTRLN